MNIKKIIFCRGPCLTRQGNKDLMCQLSKHPEPETEGENSLPAGVFYITTTPYPVILRCKASLFTRISRSISKLLDFVSTLDHIHFMRYLY